MNEGRLGKGLDRLIGDENLADQSSEHSSSSDSRLQEIPIDQISPNPYQPRQQIDPDELEGLVQSIREEGVLQPVLVRPDDQDQFTLAAGERRFRAAREAGLDTIPAVVQPLQEQRMLEIALVENVQREDLNPIEEARALERLFTDFDLDLDEISSMVGKSPSSISNKRRLLHLDERIQQLVEKKAISGGHARALLSLQDPEQQHRIAEKIVQNDLSVRNTEKMVQNLKASESDHTKPNDKSPSNDLSPELKSIQESIEEKIGTKVDIKNRKKGGEIRIRYGSNDELSAILKRMGVGPTL